jgi:uncharacterized protein
VKELPDWALRLDLSPHPEGGWFRETWRSELTVDESALPADYSGSRSAGTAILFLLMPGQQSAWHNVRSAELWMHHRGSPLLLEVGAAPAASSDRAQRDGSTTHLLGGDVESGEQPQLLVPPRHWQRARPRDDEPALVTCVVVPGFDFADFVLAAPTD